MRIRLQKAVVPAAALTFVIVLTVSPAVAVEKPDIVLVLRDNFE